MTNLTNLLTNFVNSNTASTSGSGSLPSNTIANPKGNIKAIITQSGVSYIGTQVPPPPSSLLKVVERETEVTKDTVPPTNKGSTEDVQPSVFHVETNVPISEPVVAPLVISYVNSMPLGNASRAANILEPMTPRSDLSKSHYQKGLLHRSLNHNLFSVGQLRDADLEVDFRKSTCYIRDLKENDLLTGSCGTDLYSITLLDTYTPNPICLIAKATSSQAWLWHRRLSYLNFDTINLLSKNDILIVFQS
ncbi:retrovirus-related pol polyprotein from transposon TNT 1-94 [Tanacetum coccineum]